MPASITIDDTSPHFSAVLALLSGTALTAPAPAAAPTVPAPVTPPMPAQPAPAGDDDDNAPVNAAAPSVDSSGLPWDERIHAKSKATVADGTWRKRRNVDDATVATVEAELRATVPMPPPPAPVVPVAPPMPVTTEAPAAPAPAGVMPALPAVPTAPPAPVAIATPPPSPFSAFMLEFSHKAANRLPDGNPALDADYVASVAVRTGEAFGTPMQSIADFDKHPREAEVLVWAKQLMTAENRWF